MKFSQYIPFIDCLPFISMDWDNLKTKTGCSQISELMLLILNFAGGSK